MRRKRHRHLTQAVLANTTLKIIRATQEKDDPPFLPEAGIRPVLPRYGYTACKNSNNGFNAARQTQGSRLSVRIWKQPVQHKYDKVATRRFVHSRGEEKWNR